MRANVVFLSLILLLAGLVTGVALRERAPHAISASSATLSGDESIEAVAQDDPAETPAPPAASSPAASPTDPVAFEPPPPSKPGLRRPLRVVSASWEVLAPGVMAAGGVDAQKDSHYARAGLAVELRAQGDASKVENALARTGVDPHGADVIILSLPQLTAAAERLAVLEPVVFFVAGWSAGGEVLRAERGRLTNLPKDDPLRLHGEPGSAATLVALFVFDLLGRPVELVDDPAAPFRAVTERPSDAGRQIRRGARALTTAEASRLVPYVAVAQASFLAEHPAAARVWAEGWLAGQDQLDDDPRVAARRIADAEGAPEMLTVVNDMRTIAPASLRDNARALGAAGRGMVTLPTLFERTWRLWQSIGLVVGPPQPLNVDASVVASLVRRSSRGERAAPAPDPIADRETLFTHRLPVDGLDHDALVDTIGWLAGAFPDARMALSIPFETTLAEALLSRAATRFGLAPERLAVEDADEPTTATLRVETVPP